MKKYDQALTFSFNDIGDWSILFGALAVVYKRLQQFLIIFIQLQFRLKKVFLLQTS